MLFDQHFYGLLFLLLPIWHWLTIELLLPLKFGVNLMIGLVVIHRHKRNALLIKRKFRRKPRCRSSWRHTKFKCSTSNVVDIDQVIVPSNPRMTMLIYVVGDLSPTLLCIGMILYNAFVDPQEFAHVNTRSIYYGQKLVGSGGSMTLSVIMIRVLSRMQWTFHFYLRLRATPIKA